MFHSLKEHWPEYFCEAAELGLFMISASLFTMLLWHPSSPVFNLIPNTFVRRMLTGMAMGGTAIALVSSPLGKRSGAHSNPAVTYVATLPGSHGMTIAFIAELIIAFILMTVVLNVSNTPHLARFTGIFAGCLVAIYITF